MYNTFQTRKSKIKEIVKNLEKDQLKRENKNGELEIKFMGGRVF